MKKILVAYSTNSGSTAEVAQAVGGELAKAGTQVDVRTFKDVTSVDEYAGVVVGAPMIMGWHIPAVNFVKNHEQVLRKIPVAYFFTAMSLTQSDQQDFGGIRIAVDPRLAKPPKNPRRLSFRENYATVKNYLPTALKAAPMVKPVSVAFFGGKLDIMRLRLWQKLFVMIVVQAQPGDCRNWTFIREWANDLSTKL